MTSKVVQLVTNLKLDTYCYVYYNDVLEVLRKIIDQYYMTKRITVLDRENSEYPQPLSVNNYWTYTARIRDNRAFPKYIIVDALTYYDSLDSYAAIYLIKYLHKNLRSSINNLENTSYYFYEKNFQVK